MDRLDHGRGDRLPGHRKDFAVASAGGSLHHVDACRMRNSSHHAGGTLVVAPHTDVHRTSMSVHVRPATRTKVPFTTRIPQSHHLSFSDGVDTVRMSYRFNDDGCSLSVILYADLLSRKRS